VALEGTCLDLADSVANDERFGRPGVNKGERPAFPQARVMALAECESHAIFEAVIGPHTTSENSPAGTVLTRLTPGMLCLVDRGFYCFEAWQVARSTLSQRSASSADPPPSKVPFPPWATDVHDRPWCHAIAELARRLLPKRWPRANPRVGKHKYIRWHVKRCRHRAWPSPPDCRQQPLASLIERY